MLYIVGLGLGDERDITVRGLDAVRSCAKVYMEAYTSLLSLGLNPSGLANLEKLYGKEITIADREMVEEHADQMLREAADTDVTFLVVGDPFSAQGAVDEYVFENMRMAMTEHTVVHTWMLWATTHTDLVVRAKQMGVEVKVIHNASVMNAVGVCGLQLYHYGETISIPFFTEAWRPDSFYKRIQNNRQLRLHTLCLLAILPTTQASDMAGARSTPTRTPPSPASRTEPVIPPDWASALSLVSSHPAPPVVVLCGPKNSGKSTFSRLLLNELLPRYGRVGYLDTDVGQPEFAPPGCISFHVVDEAIEDLLNPALREAERFCFFGDVSSKRDPEAYLKCVFHLYAYFVEKYRCDVNEMLPLIVNTPGWVKGAGFDMLVEMLRHICPTIVVQIRITMKNKNLPDGIFWQDGDQISEMININAPFRDASDRSLLILKDSFGMRERRLAEYLKQCFPRDISVTTNKELAYALASVPPCQVPFSDVKVMHLHCEVPSTEVWYSLNATIVGLASETPGSVPYCVGLGIVRGIDFQKGLLYLITPVPLRRLQSVDLLLQGLIEIPTSLLQVHGCVSPYMSTNVLHKIAESDLYAE